MRVQDLEKKEALFEATVKLVNEIGFASSSVSKIAKEAGVSPSTLYVYHENKEDLLVSTYVTIKQKMSEAVLVDFDASLPVRDVVRSVWLRMFRYVSEHTEYYQYCEQFANSPYSEKVNRAVLEQYFGPIFKVIERGMAEKIIKDLEQPLLVAFLFHPLTFLANPRLSHGFVLTDDHVDLAFDMTWDAIKF